MNGGLRRLAAVALALSMVALSGCAGAAGSPPPGTTPAASAPPASPAASAPVPTPESTAPLSPHDADALAQLADVAPRTSTINPDLADWTECWLPSTHVLPAENGNTTTWRVLCRIHWHQKDGAARYQDTTCVGDFAKQPMLDHCYRWVYYDYEPRFEDAPAVRASA